MDSVEILFYFLSGLILTSAVVILMSKNIARSVFLLMVIFIAIAIIYFISGAEFVGVTQIMIYVGGILILMMFGVMLTSRIDGNFLITENTRVLSGMLVGLSIFGTIIYALFYEENVFGLNIEKQVTSTEQIGVSLMTENILALEIVAILLLVALVGASFIAGTKSIDES